MSSRKKRNDCGFNLRSSLWESRELFTDISLVCIEGQSRQIIRGHKIIFAASSPYFSKMLSLRPRDEIFLPKVDFHVLQNLIKFIYTGQIPSSAQEFGNFVKLGKKLSVRGLPTSWSRPRLNTEFSEISTSFSEAVDNVTALPEENPRNRKRRAGQIAKTGSTSFEPAAKLRRCTEQPIEAPTDSSTESRCDISELPTEILLEIFSYVPTYDLLHNVARVSRQFYSLTRDPDAHRSVTFTNHVNTDRAVKFLEKKTKIEELHLIRICDSIVKDYGIRDLWYSVIIRLKKIRVIEVTRPWHLSSKMLDLLGQDPEKAKQLTTIIANTSMYRRDTEFNWTYPTSIKHLELNGYPTTSYLLEIGQSTDKLERLKSTSTLVYSDGMKYLFQANKKTLKEVNLCGYRSSNNDVKALSFCENLEILGLDCSNVAPESLQLFSKMDNLRILKIELSHQFFSPEDVTEFLAFQNKLQTLSLTYDGVFNDSMMAAVARLSQLNELTLYSKNGHSDVTDRGFFDVFSRCVNLKSLILKMPIIFVDLEQESLGCSDWSTLHQPNLRYLLPGNGGLLPRKTIKTMLRRSSALRCCLQGDTLFVKSDTTCGEIFAGFETSDLSEIWFNKVVMF